VYGISHEGSIILPLILFAALISSAFFGGYYYLEKTSGACFAYKLEQCRGACIGRENILAHNIRFIEALSENKIKRWPFSGPIIITEYDPIDGRKEEYVVNKWCLISDKNDVAPADLSPICWLSILFLPWLVECRKLRYKNQQSHP